MNVSRRDHLILATVAGVFLGLAAGLAPAGAEPDLKSRLDAVERDLDRSRSERSVQAKTADQTTTEIRDLKKRGVALAARLHEQARSITTLEQRLYELERDETAQSDRFAQRRRELTATLGALQRMARMPAAAIAALPQSPDDTIRSAILLRSAVPALQREAAELKTSITSLSELRADIQTERAALGTALETLDTERRTLAALTAKKLKLLNSARSAEQDAASRIERLSTQASDLKDLLEKIERDRADARSRVRTKVAPPKKVARLAPLPAPRTTERKPHRRSALPAPGRVVTKFNDKLSNGALSRGVTIETRPGAQIVAPLRGQVVFAGTFRGYGNLVILELQDKGHALVSGMARIDAAIGDDVLAGEPLGVMTPSTSIRPRLYFELRRRGRPINPMPQRAAQRNKVSGS